ncbi:MAG TPA: hypothetical protein VKM93_24530 [Terriglobia bacterium]|nr:hypothetical protein [Terriglobia bacterium]
MSEFVARSAEFSGGFAVAGPVDQVFELFSPLGEKLWVPQWNPELLHPPGVSWERGLIFRTQEEKGEAIWVVTALEREAHEVEYHRVESGRYVARVTVACKAETEGQTQVGATYVFVGLSPEGNVDIAIMTRESYVEKMKRWERWISESFARNRTVGTVAGVGQRHGLGLGARGTPRGVPSQPPVGRKQ